MPWYVSGILGFAPIGALLLIIGLVASLTFTIGAGSAGGDKTGIGLIGAGCALGLGIIAAAVLITS